MEHLFGDKVSAEQVIAEQKNEREGDEALAEDKGGVIAENEDKEPQGIELVELELKERENAEKQQIINLDTNEEKKIVVSNEESKVLTLGELNE